MVCKRDCSLRGRRGSCSKIVGIVESSASSIVEHGPLLVNNPELTAIYNYLEMGYLGESLEQYIYILYFPI